MFLFHLAYYSPFQQVHAPYARPATANILARPPVNNTRPHSTISTAPSQLVLSDTLSFNQSIYFSHLPFGHDALFSLALSGIKHLHALHTLNLLN
jgi:hypothetical protein